MYGLFLRALQCYTGATFGAKAWSQVMARAGVLAEGFEPLLDYDAALLRKVLRAAAQVLARPAEAMLEDVGTYIVTRSPSAATRRLLRFGGASFPEFLLSLEELPSRARLALPEVDFPRLTLSECGPGEYRLSCRVEVPELMYVLLGVLAAMADDYGALVVLEVEPPLRGRASLAIRLAEARFAEGRSFRLVAG